MKVDLLSMTNSELKQYISANRTDGEAFRAALDILLSRRDPSEPIYPYEFGLNGSENELKAILQQRIEKARHQNDAGTES